MTEENEERSNLASLNLPLATLGCKEEAILKSLGINVEVVDGKKKLILPGGEEFSCYAPCITWIFHGFGKTDDYHHRLQIVRTEDNYIVPGDDRNTMPAATYRVKVERVYFPKAYGVPKKKKDKTIIDACGIAWL